PNLVTVEASRDRLELAGDAGCMTLAADAAETIRARNSLEKMLAHQLASAHNLAMRLSARAAEHTINADNIEAARVAAAAARRMDTFQRGLPTVDRLRNGGQQTVTIKHLNVSEGGQAIVAGSVGGRAKAGGKRGSK